MLAISWIFSLSRRHLRMPLDAFSTQTRESHAASEFQWANETRQPTSAAVNDVSAYHGLGFSVRSQLVTATSQLPLRQGKRRVSMTATFGEDGRPAAAIGPAPRRYPRCLTELDRACLAARSGYGEGQSKACGRWRSWSRAREGLRVASHAADSPMVVLGG